MKGTVFKREFVCDDIAVITIKLEEPLHFIPGQYVTITFLDVLKRRPFSILAYDSNTLELKLCIEKRGVVTSRVFIENVPFDLDIGKPKGRFVLEDMASPNSVIFIAGGVGIVPCYNILFQQKLSPKNLSLFYSAKTKERMPFREDCLSKEGLHFFERLTSHSTRFTFKDIVSKVSDIKSSYIFICGSPDFVRYFKEEAIHFGCEKSLIKTEVF